MTSHPLSRGRGSTACCPSCRNSFSGGGWRPWVVGGRHGIGVGTRRRRVRLNPRSRHRLAPTWVQLCRDTVPTLPRENLPATCHLRPPPATRNDASTFAPLHAAPPHLHFCTVSLPASGPHLAELGFEVRDGCGVGARFLSQFLQDDLEINGRLKEVSRPHGDIAGQRRAAVGPR
jgi:hypothetical protein